MPFFVKATTSPRSKRIDIFALYPDGNLTRWGYFDRRNNDFSNYIPERKVRGNPTQYIATRLTPHLPPDIFEELRRTHWINNHGEDIDPAFLDFGDEPPEDD